MPLDHIDKAKLDAVITSLVLVVDALEDIALKIENLGILLALPEDVRASKARDMILERSASESLENGEKND